MILSVAAFSAPSARASAFYNQPESGQPNPLTITFKCGFFCFNQFVHIPLNGTWSRPGKSGYWVSDNIGGWTGRDSQACERLESHSAVTDHGWVVLTDPSNQYVWNIYDNNGNPNSDSPSPVTFGEWHGGATPDCYPS